MTQPARTVRKFNPGTGQSDKELVRQFVVREKELEVALDILRSNIDAPCCQNTLVVAPRGAGKTMLLARIAAELRANDAFSQYLLPVRFMEESFEAYDIGEFWLEALFHLALEIERSTPDLATELRRSHQELCDHWRPDLATQALATLLDAADQLDRRLVLLVENLADLSRDVDDDFGWSLRGVLQNEPRLMLLGSATTRFQELDDASEPFFELFRFVYLKPLDSAACVRLWNAVSGMSTSERDVRPLEIFTGGSPRLLIIVAQFARHRSLTQLMDEFVTLIDDHTEYFRSHLERLAKGERRVYVAIIDLWQPSTTGEIAQRARMGVRQASTCIGRLVGRGMVSTRGSGGRKRYVSAERLYSIYYKLRRERDEAVVVQNLIRFMAAFYTPRELMEMSDDFAQEASESPAVYSGLARALVEEPKFVEAFESAFLAPQAKAIQEGRSKDALRSCEQLLSDEPLPAATTSKVLLMRAACFSDLGDHDAEVATYDELLLRYGRDTSSGVQGVVLAAQLNRGVVRDNRGDVAGAMDDYDEVVGRLDGEAVCGNEETLAAALQNKATALRQSQQFAALISTLNETIARFGASDAPFARTATITALVNKGTTLHAMGDTSGAVAAYRDVLDRHAGCGIDEVQEPLAGAHFNMAVGLRELSDQRGAVAAYQALATKFGHTSDPAVQHWVARGSVNLGVLLSRDLNDSAQAVVTYDGVVAKFGDVTTPSVQRQVAKALLNRGVAQRGMGDDESALASWNDMVDRFGAGTDANTRDLVISALLHRARTLAATGAYAESYAALSRILDQLGGTDEERVRALLGWALVTRCGVDLAVGRANDALETSAVLEREFADLERESFAWQARCHAVRAHLALGGLALALAEFELAYQAFTPTEATVHQLSALVSEGLAAGLSPTDLANVLSTQNDKASTVAPLLIALRQEAGDEVRAPEESLDVAADIRAAWRGQSHQ